MKDIDIPKEILERIINRLNKVDAYDKDPILEEWLKSSENRVQYDRLVQLWKKTEEIPFLSAADKLKDFEKIQRSIKGQKQRTFTTYYWKIAVAVILLIGVFSILISPFAEQGVVYEAKAHSVEITLPDSSRITLNKGGVLRVDNDFGVQERRVELVGEAFFRIAKDPQKPFAVRVGNVETVVLGTRFNIDQIGEQVKIDVYEGKVSFHTDKDEILLEKQQSAYYTQKSDQIIASEFNINTNSWMTHRLVFKNVKLEKLTRDVSNHFSVDIQVNHKIKDVKLTTVFENPTLDEVLNELEMILQVEVKKIGDKKFRIE